MRLIISMFLPWLTFFTIGRPIAGVYLPGIANNSHRLGSSNDLVGIRVKPVQNR